jgi:Flp pilus assembly secretin CpaC
MKHFLLPLLTTFAATALPVCAESPAPGSPNVRIEVQIVSMLLEKGLPLLPNLLDAGSIDGAFSQIQEMIAAGEATLVGWPQVVTMAGQRAVTEDIQEVRYASEFDSHRPATASPGAADKPGAQMAAPVRSGAPVPTAFETRNIGATLEVEPVIKPDGKTIDLNIVPQHVRLLEFKAVASGRDANGHDWKIEQPLFFTAKTTTSLTVPSGQRVLLAEFRGPEGSDQIEFFILKAEVIPGAAKSK